MVNQIFIACAFLAAVSLPSASCQKCGDCKPLEVTGKNGATSTTSGCFTVNCKPAQGKAASISNGIGATLADTVQADKEISFSLACKSGIWYATVNGYTGKVDALICESINIIS